MMNQETYDYVLEILSREPSFNEGIRQLKYRRPSVFESVGEKTLKSIQAQYYVRRMRRNHHHHYSRDTREKYYKLYTDAKSRNEKNVIMRLAAKNDISPCLLARIILEEYYWNDVDHGRDRERGDGRGSLPPGFMTDCIRDIARLPNPELAGEIYETIVLDNFYGPAVDSVKKCCGAEYEMILKAHCRKAGFSFIDEDQMRDAGYDKTPDIKLKVPIMINHRVVNWIESKASFGDPINHQQYMIDQYLPYKNRFGPGAVIYWFGFVQELAETGERGILLLNKFPEAGQITLLRDVHEQERDSVGFHLRQLDKNVDKKCDNYTDSVERQSKFYNYVDPMFDFDEETNLAETSIANVEQTCSSSNVSSKNLSETLNYYTAECSQLLEIKCRISADVVGSGENIDIETCKTNECGVLMCGRENEAICHINKTFQASAEIINDSEKPHHLKFDSHIPGHRKFFENVINSERVTISFLDEDLTDSKIIHHWNGNSSCDKLCVVHDHEQFSCSALLASTSCPETFNTEISMHHSEKSLYEECAATVKEESTAAHLDKPVLISSSPSKKSDKKNKKKKRKRNR